MIDPEKSRLVLVLGATGATGCLVVEQLLERGHRVRAIVRSPAALAPDTIEHPGFELIRGTVLDLPDDDVRQALVGCDAIVCCLGHRLSFAGLFGPPWRLVRDSIRRACNLGAGGDRGKPIRVVHMCSTGCRDHANDPPVSLAQRLVVGLIRLLIPPHADNEASLAFFRHGVGALDGRIEWTVVRPDGLIDEPRVTPYTVTPSPERSAIFDPGTSSRINVAHFMAELATDDRAFEAWKSACPVLYNRAGSGVSSSA